MLVNSSVLTELASREKAWVAGRTALRLAAGEASSCASYSQLKSSGIVEDVSNELVKSEYLICDVLERLGPHPELQAISDADFGAVLASRLDLRSFPSSLAPRLDEHHHTLAHLFDTQVKVASDGAWVKTTDLSFTLKVVLVGDTDQDGRPDWLVWLTDESLDGNYRSYQTLLIKDVTPDGPLWAQNL